MATNLAIDDALLDKAKCVGGPRRDPWPPRDEPRRTDPARFQRQRAEPNPGFPASRRSAVRLQQAAQALLAMHGANVPRDTVEPPGAVLRHVISSGMAIDYPPRGRYHSSSRGPTLRAADEYPDSTWYNWGVQKALTDLGFGPLRGRAGPADVVTLWTRCG